VFWDKFEILQVLDPDAINKELTEHEHFRHATMPRRAS
jgi:hypothetical protein